MRFTPAHKQCLTKRHVVAHFEALYMQMSIPSICRLCIFIIKAGMGENPYAPLKHWPSSYRMSGRLSNVRLLFFYCMDNTDELHLNLKLSMLFRLFNNSGHNIRVREVILLLNRRLWQVEVIYAHFTNLKHIRLRHQLITGRIFFIYFVDAMAHTNELNTPMSKYVFT